MTSLRASLMMNIYTALTGHACFHNTHPDVKDIPPQDAGIFQFPSWPINGDMKWMPSNPLLPFTRSIDVSKKKWKMNYILHSEVG